MPILVTFEGEKILIDEVDYNTAKEYQWQFKKMARGNLCLIS